MRHPNHDYTTPGAYFVTFVTSKRSPILGKIDSSRMELSECGKIVERCWYELAGYFAGLGLDAFQIMPDHVHAIIILNGRILDGQIVHPPYSLPDVIKALKSISGRLINSHLGSTGKPVWQQGYQEHYVRSDRELDRFRKYIINNPPRYELDD